jgi:glutamate-1-semialdehyde aminotransferase
MTTTSDATGLVTHSARRRRVATGRDVLVKIEGARHGHHDAVKLGGTVAGGGAGDRYGVRRHLACFAKALYGGTPRAAFGGDDTIIDVIAHGAAQMGTFNDNPPVAAAGLASLTEIMTPVTYVRLAQLATKPGRFGAAFPWAFNRDVFMTPGDKEQWTLSVQHGDADIALAS